MCSHCVQMYLGGSIDSITASDFTTSPTSGKFCGKSPQGPTVVKTYLQHLILEVGFEGSDNEWKEEYLPQPWRVDDINITENSKIGVIWVHLTLLPAPFCKGTQVVHGLKMCSVWLQRQGPCARNGHGPQWKHHPSQLNLNRCTWVQVLLQCCGSQPKADRYTVDTRKFDRFRWHDWSWIILIYLSSMMRSSFLMFRAWKSPRKMEPSKGFNQADAEMPMGNVNWKDVVL